MAGTADKTTTRGFLIDQYHHFRNGTTEFYGMGRLETGESFGIIDNRQAPRFFIRQSDREQAEPLAAARDIPVRACDYITMDGEPVCSLETANQSALRRLAETFESQGIRTYEADINLSHQYLMAHGIRGSLGISGEWRKSEYLDRVYVNPLITPADWFPDLTVLSFDMETNHATGEILGISFVSFNSGTGEGTEQMVMSGKPGKDDPPYLQCYPSEKEMLRAAVSIFRKTDPDIVTGWNVIDFDIRVLYERLEKHRIPFTAGRSRDAVRHDKRRGDNKDVFHMPGRQILDCMQLLRWGSYRFEDFKLDTVAHEILGRNKTQQFEGDESKPETIVRLYKENRRQFCDYCLEDSRLVRDIALKTGILDLTINRSRLIGLPMERSWGSVAPFEFIYTGELHKRYIAAPTRGTDQDPEGIGAPGGLVMTPETGLHPHILVFDFKSLYPSIIRTFNIDPLSFAGGKTADDALVAPNGFRFSREPGILPGVLDRFFESREQAKKDGNETASYAYKIIMNSFYGVLGSPTCRFASPGLAGAITGFGQTLLRWLKAYLEEKGFRVLYGDTDSVFVDARMASDVTPDRAMKRGAELAVECNRALVEHVKEKYRVESRLELEFEKYYRRLLLPSVRGGEEGRAKSYAGHLWTGSGWEREVTGMESVRTDWTALARSLQETLLDMIFEETPPEKISKYLHKLVDEMLAGKRDDELVYRKNIRKPLDSYVKSTPPHVKAARMLDRPVRVVYYYLTEEGPQPVEKTEAPLDYKHYIEKQIIPIVETLAPYLGTDISFLDSAGDKQTSLF